MNPYSAKMVIVLASLVLLVIPLPVHAMECNASIGKEYSLPGEGTEFYSSVKIKNPSLWTALGVGNTTNEYCVFRYTNHDRSYSEIVVINGDGGRLSKDDTNLVVVSFSQKSMAWIEENYNILEPRLQEMYNALLSASEKSNDALPKIRQVAQPVLESVHLEIPLKGPLKIDVIQAINELLKTVPDWDATIQKYKAYKETIDQLSKARQRGYVSYDDEVAIFYKQSVAVEILAKSLEQNGLLNENGKDLGFQAAGETIRQSAEKEASLIEARLAKKKDIAFQANTSLENAITNLDSKVDKALEKEIDVGNLGKMYCSLRKSRPSVDLINTEKFQTYIDAARIVTETAEKETTNLDTQINQRPPKFGLWIWLDKNIRWPITHWCL